ncbi:hypothetical protein [Kitasatospora sp. NPDC059673]|uniref:hypothetical protein n=1 Tax=Kitasatospora sp. NPDC059673 TaxID=3346901 RepID=UPI003692FBF1
MDPAQPVDRTAALRQWKALAVDAILARAADTAAFGLNAVSDGSHVVLPGAARKLVRQLRTAGYRPVPVAVPELRKAGGGPKCRVLELRSE